MAPTRQEPSPSGASPLADAEIVERVLGGELALFELLIVRHNQSLFRAARAILRDDAEAEDVVQDAWVRTYGALRGFTGRASFSTWVLRITVHEALARRRRGRRFSALGGSLPSPSSSPEDEASAGELRYVLAAAVDSLSDGHRAVFVLREVQGLTTAQTAAVLALSQENVKIRLHRAKAALRRDLDRRLGRELRNLWIFAGARCDGLAARVMARLRSSLVPA
jgi:RNA polymerase sigma-70 factor (ECF subfamily)